MAIDPIIEQLTKEQPYYVVLRRCHAVGEARFRGEVIDTSELRRDRVQTMVDRHVLFMLPYGLKPPAEVEIEGYGKRRVLPGWEAPAVKAEPTIKVSDEDRAQAAAKDEAIERAARQRELDAEAEEALEGAVEAVEEVSA